MCQPFRFIITHAPVYKVAILFPGVNNPAMSISNVTHTAAMERLFHVILKRKYFVHVRYVKGVRDPMTNINTKLHD
ncbi:hypothetical protein CFK40_18410 [Virgibacillus necropolis]|uniref:Uncharacterized protein n=1 Tax=Virgibacillus necropolis TaxID=163877 RepID=A0A221MGR2_9BACI|nr:hypothetical protein CFK40_18410 [Virgibacillus necropolis]